MGVLWGDIDVLPQISKVSFLEAGAGCKERGYGIGRWGEAVKVGHIVSLGGPIGSSEPPHPLVAQSPLSIGQSHFSLSASTPSRAEVHSKAQ